MEAASGEDKANFDSQGFRSLIFLLIEKGTVLFIFSLT